MRHRRPLLAPIVAIALFAGAARAEQLETLSGDLDEEVKSIAREGEELVLTTAKRKIPCGEVKEVRFAPAARDPRQAQGRVFLSNGDELAGEVVGGDPDKVVVKTASLGTIEVKLEAVRAIAFTGDEPDLRRFRKEILPLETKTDIVVTRSWGRTEGVLEKIDDRGVSIEAKAIGKVTVSPEKALGARIAPIGKPAPPPPGLRARLDLADGSFVTGALEALDGGVVKLHGFRPGIEVKVAEIQTLSFLGGKFVYVSDLTPTEVDERPALISIKHPWRRDRNVLDEPLRLDGKTYRKGLGVHAYSRLVFTLDGQFAKLRARIGLDDGARAERSVDGTVKFQVLVDGKPALGPEGLALSTSDPARPIEVEVAGARTLTLIADFGESQDVLSRGDWADAYLVKK